MTDKQQKDKTEQYLEYIIQYMGELQQQAKPKERAKGDILLEILENKSFYVDEWNTPKHTTESDISASQLTGNLLDNSLAAVVGDAIPEIIGYFFGGVKGTSKDGNSYYLGAKNRVENRWNKVKNLEKKGGDGGQGGVPAWIAPKETRELGGRKVTPEYLVKPEETKFGGMSSYKTVPSETFDNLFTEYNTLAKRFQNYAVESERHIRDGKIDLAKYKTFLNTIKEKGG